MICNQTSLILIHHRRHRAIQRVRHGAQQFRLGLLDHTIRADDLNAGSKQIFFDDGRGDREPVKGNADLIHAALCFRQQFQFGARRSAQIRNAR